jgi:sigma-E factor negative regulatory protein RseA
MSDQIKEQISAFLDGELPGPESELLLKRLLRDSSLRESFGRYSLIGEAMRGMKHVPLRGNFTSAINGAIDGEPARPASGGAPAVTRWGLWRVLGGAAVAAGVAVVAVIALQLRAPAPPISASVNTPPSATFVVAPPLTTTSHEPKSYVTPSPNSRSPNAIPGARLTNYVFAHSQYSSLLGQRDVMTDLIVDVDQPNPEADTSTTR